MPTSRSPSRWSRSPFTRATIEPALRSALLALAVLATGLGCHEITGVSPNPAPPGSVVTITGISLGDGNGPGDAVGWGATPVSVLSWNQAQIQVRLPSDIVAGTYPVRVQSGGRVSQSFEHTVVGPLAVGSAAFAPNPKNHLSGTLTFRTNRPIPDGSIRVEVLEAGAAPWTVPASSTGTGEDGMTHGALILGLIEKRDYRFKISVADGAEVRVDQSVAYRPDPNDLHFPDLPREVRVSNPAEMASGLTLFGYIRSLHPGLGQLSAHLVAVDAGGNIVWHHDAGSGVVTMHVDRMANGNIMYLRAPPFSGDGEIVEIDPMGKRIRSYSSGPDGYHHTFTELPNGNLLVAGSEMRRLSGYSQEEAGCTTCNVVADRIQELDRRTGEIAWEVTLFDFLSPYRWTHNSFDAPFYDSTYGVSTRDLTHLNCLVYDARDDSFLVSMRNQNIVAKFKRDPFEWVWAIGEDEPDNPHDDDYPWLTPVGGAIPPVEQHSVHLLENGNVLVYDNRAVLSTQGSRAVEYVVDEAAGTYREAWSWRDGDYSPPLLSFFTGSATPTPDGTVLMADTGMGSYPVLLFFSFRWARYAEVRASDGLKLWEMWVEDPTGDWSYTGFDAMHIPSLYP